VAIGAVGLSLAVVLPAQAAVQANINTPADGQHYTQGDGASTTGSCTQTGAGAVVAACNVAIVYGGSTIADYNVPVDGSNSVPFNEPLSTGTQGFGSPFFVVVKTDGTGGGEAISQVSYFVDAPPVGPPSASISGPGNGTSVNPGATLFLTSGCSAGSNGTLASCNGTVTRPGGGQTGISGSGGQLPTDVSGDYSVTVTATDTDGQTNTTSISYTVNTPPTAVIDAPVDGGVVNQGDVDTWGGHCVPGNSVLTDCTFTVTDPNGNSVGVNGNHTPTATVGIYHVHVHAADAHGLTGDVFSTYRVNAYPTVDITSPLQGLRVYTDTAVPAAYSCADHEGPVASCLGSVPVGANADTSPAGPKSFNVTATDSDHAQTTKTVTYNVYDKPTAHITGPAIGTVVNPGDGAPIFLGNCAGGVPNVVCTMTLTAPDGTTSTLTSGETLPIAQYGSYRMTVHVIDDFGTEQTATQTYKVNEAPHIVNLTPLDGDTFFQGQNVTPNYSCYDNDHDGTITDDSIASCVGPAGPLATQNTPVGVYTYSVKAVDNDGAATTQTVSYKVVPVVGSCQATGLQLLDLVFGNSGPADPCATGDGVTVKANAPLGALAPSLLLNTGVQANVIEGHTVRTKPATFAAHADIADTSVNILGTVNLKVTGVHTTASSTLTSCSTAQLTGTSSVGTLSLNGLPITVGSTPLTIPLVIGTLYLNQRVVTATGITERAVFLDLPGTALDVVIGASSVAPRCGTL
jgi:hypothetical protein